MLYQLIATVMTIVSVSGFMGHHRFKMDLHHPQMPQKMDTQAFETASVISSNLGKTISVSWTDCSSSDAKGSVTSVAFTPDPPLVGQNNSIVGTGTVSEEVTDGTWEIKVYDGALKVADDSGDICQADTITLPLNAGYLYYVPPTCPVAVGSVDVTLIADIASGCPTGTITTELTAKDSSKNELFCVSVAMVISN